MDTFQSVVFSILYSVSQLLPLSFDANTRLLGLLTEWSPPETLYLHAMALGVFLAMLFYFRHDWISIVASFLKTLFSFRRPTSIDDYLFWFLVLGTAPALILRDLIREMWTPPIWAYAAGLVVLSFWLWFGEKWTRNKKSMLGWGFMDAFLLGVFNILAILPGGNFVLSAMGLARARHFQMEAAVKMTYFCVLIAIGADAIPFFGFFKESGSTFSLSLALSILVPIFVTTTLLDWVFQHKYGEGYKPYYWSRGAIAAGLVAAAYYHGELGF